ncbi:MAG: 6-phosphofructokinase [Thermodesulfobacteriota bacterium]
MKIGILTGGGDCPGLNAVIRAVVKRGLRSGHEFVGIKDGWAGLVKPETVPLGRDNVSGILPIGGTILGTSRTNPYKNEADVERLKKNVSDLGIDVIVAIGGDDTLGVAGKLYKDGLKTMGIPKTIDNDLSGTDFTFGFDTAVSIVTWALDRLHTTTEAHHRVMVVEVMGRHAGWIAVYGGIAGGADVILIPEKPFDIEEVCGYIEKRKAAGKHFSLVVVAEGAFPREAGGMVTKGAARDAFGHARLGGVGESLAKVVEEKTGIESRFVVLGHLQRGGTPTAYDRILATRYGVKAVDLIDEGVFGRMVALQGNEIVDVTLHEATSVTKTVDPDLYKIAEIFFG